METLNAQRRLRLRERIEDALVEQQIHLEMARRCGFQILELLREDARKYRPRTEAQKEAAPPQQEQAA